MPQKSNLFKLYPSSKKKKRLYAEIESKGYSILWVPGTFARYKNCPAYLIDAIAFTDFENKRIVVSKESFLHVRKMYDQFDPGVKRLYKQCNDFGKPTIIELVIHEFAHILFDQERLHWSYPPDDVTNRVHGLRFSEIYSELADKYHIQYPDLDYYIKNAQ